MPDYFGSLSRVELSWAVFLLPLPTALALVLWSAPAGLGLAATLRRSVAMVSGLLTAAFTIGFAAALGNLGPGKRTLLGHAFSFVRVGSFDTGLTLHVDALALGFVALVALASWVLQTRLGQDDRYDGQRGFALWWALGSIVAILADDMGLALAGLGVATLALVLLAGGDPRTIARRRTALLGIPLVAAGYALLFWLPGGTWSRDDFVPDGKGRFGSVEAKARTSAPPVGAKGGGDDGSLTMTGSPGSWVVLDGDGGSTFASPFTRRRVPAGLHTARIVGGAASDDVELATFFIPPGGESFVGVVGPTSSLREAKNQLSLSSAGNKIDLRGRLRDYHLLGLPAGVLAGLLLAAGGLAAAGFATTRTRPATAEDEEGAALLELPTLAARVILAPYLTARAAAFLDPSPAQAGTIAVLCAVFALLSALSAHRQRRALATLGPTADALGLLATAMVFASAPAGALVIATTALAGLCLATIGASATTKTDSPLYLSGVALIALPPLGIALPWAAGHATASLYAGKLALSLPLAIAFVVAVAATIFALGQALFRVAPPGSLAALDDPAANPRPAKPAAEDGDDSPRGAQKTKKAKKKAGPVAKLAEETAASPKFSTRERTARLPQVLLAVGALSAIVGALPIASLLGVTSPLFGWIEEGAKLRPGAAPPALGATLLLVLAGLVGYVQGKKAHEARSEGTTDAPDPTLASVGADRLAPLGEALRGLRSAFAQGVPPHAADATALAETEKADDGHEEAPDADAVPSASETKTDEDAPR